MCRTVGDEIGRARRVAITGALAATALMLLGQPALAAGVSPQLEKELVVATGGGSFERALQEHFFEAFTAATGVKVIPVAANPGVRWAKVKAMAQVRNIEWDMTLAVESEVIANEEFIATLDCQSIADAQREGTPGACQRWGLLAVTGRHPIVYDRQAFASGARPEGWQDFWDVRRFPGPRGLPNYGNPAWVLMMALVADGVPGDKLFPLDLDRAFRKLDEIRPHVKVWWKTGDQSVQIMRDGEVVMNWVWTSRVPALKELGRVDVIWNQAIVDESYWVTLRSAPHPNAALAFLNFFMKRPEAHLAFTRAMTYETSNRRAVGQMSAEERIARGVEFQEKVLRPDHRWIAANQGRILERWNTWLAR